MRDQFGEPPDDQDPEPDSLMGAFGDEDPTLLPSLEGEMVGDEVPASEPVSVDEAVWEEPDPQALPPDVAKAAATFNRKIGRSSLNEEPDTREMEKWIRPGLLALGAAFLVLIFFTSFCGGGDAPPPTTTSSANQGTATTVEPDQGVVGTTIGPTTTLAPGVTTTITVPPDGPPPEGEQRTSDEVPEEFLPLIPQGWVAVTQEELPQSTVVYDEDFDFIALYIGQVHEGQACRVWVVIKKNGLVGIGTGEFNEPERFIQPDSVNLEKQLDTHAECT